MDNNVTSWRDKIKGHYPEREFADDDSYGDAATEMIDQLKGDNDRLTGEAELSNNANQKLLELFEQEPAIADFLADILKGASLPVALARNFDIEAITPQEGEPDYQEWDTQRKDRIAKNEARKKTEAELTANKVESSKAFEEFKAKRNWSEEQLDEFLGTIDDILEPIYKGKVTTDFLEMVEVAANHKSELEATRQAALVEGKNTAIEEKKVIKPKGDGLPKPGNMGEMPEKPAKTPDIFDRVNSNYQNRKRYN